MDQMKTCNMCLLVLPIDDFYKAGEYYQAKCKPCYNAHCMALAAERFKTQPRPVYPVKPRVYVPKERVTPFQRLAPEIRESILKYIGTMPVSKVARMHNMKPQTLRIWRQKKIIV